MRQAIYSIEGGTGNKDLAGVHVNKKDELVDKGNQT